MTARPYVLVLPASADRTDWLNSRRDGIGSSDVAAVLGVSGYSSPQRVYYEKRGDLPVEGDAGDAALWGTLDEETTAREWARRNRSVIRRIGLIARRDAPHHMCTLDRLILECPLRHTAEVCALEVKHRSAWLAGKWKRSVPDDVLAQVLWQLWITGYDHIHVACRIGGNDYRQYVIRAADHQALIADIVTVVDRAWADIRAGRPPAVTGEEPVDDLLDLYAELHPDRSGMVVLNRDPAVRLATREDLLAYEVARLQELAAKKLKDAAKARLIERLGDAEVGVLDDGPAYRWTSTTRDGEPLVKAYADLDGLAERHPGAYADVVELRPQRRFSLDSTHRLKELPA